jgi:hypothetical protein
MTFLLIKLLAKVNSLLLHLIKEILLSNKGKKQRKIIVMPSYQK